MKRIFDFILAGVALSIFWPVLLIVALAIKLDSSGPALYRGSRAGRGGVLFFMLKFRTMVLDADKLGGPSTANGDPRITRIGTILRKFKLDELPQLINVLTGKMSFVGPRPEVMSEVQTYSPEERELLTVRPGITDWASLHFRNEGEILAGSPDPHQTYRAKIRPQKMELGLRYIRERSFLVDLRILIQTVKALLGMKDQRQMME